MELGVTKIQDVCARRKIDWRSHMRGIAQAEKFKQELAKEYGIAPDSIAFKQFKAGKDLGGEPLDPAAGSSAKTQDETRQLAAPTE